MIRHRLARLVRRFGDAAYQASCRTVAHADRAQHRAWWAMRELSGRIAGCGCVADDAETCHGEWCECACHRGAT